MQRIILLILVVAAGFLGVRWTIRALASEETKIRWLIEEMATGFNEERVGAAVKGLAADWRHEDGRLDRDLLRGYLAREFLASRGSAAAKLAYTVEVPEDTLQIIVEGDTATLQCDAIFQRRRQSQAETVWHARVEADLEQREDGWRIVRSSHEDIVGRGLR